MRIPNMSKVRKEDFSTQTHEIKRITYYGEGDGVFYDLSDEKTKVAFIKYVESIIRASGEYRNFIKMLKDELDMNSCSYFHKINKKDYSNVGIEMHHSPFSLFDLCLITLNKHMDEGIAINVFCLAEEVMLHHYIGIVGLIPLSTTAHELVHVGQVFIPIHYVYGDVSSYYKEHWKYMTEVQKETLLKLINVSEELSKTVPHVFNKKFIYLDVEGMSLPKTLKV